MAKNLQNKITNKKSGFTLVELIVVIAILAILAVITIPRFSQYAERARNTALDANARTILSACAAAETKLIADNAKPGATIVTVDATNIAKEANKSLAGISLATTTDDDKLTTFQLKTYDADTSQFYIYNNIGDGETRQWNN